ncbi:putative Zinc finger, C3HC4 type (RING finger) [Trypanosoma cruzi]|nr:putative Zinc finger, C3HC4 type (RING finger) [Trypanosoma cruzi]
MGNALAGVCRQIRCLDANSPRHERRRSPRAASFSSHPSRLRKTPLSPLKPGGKIACEVCGICFDPVGLEKHCSMCRASRGVETEQARSCLGCTGEGLPNDEPEELCVVCFAEKRMYAFLPCGHVACCSSCGKLVDRCPVCREERFGYCVVNTTALLQFKCPHCRAIVAPELYDGHREVCAIQSRAAQVGHSGPATDADTRSKNAATSGRRAEGGGNHPPAAVPAKRSASSHGITPNFCIECRRENAPLVIIGPCGHRVLCDDCFAGRITCPVCLREIEHGWKSYI